MALLITLLNNNNNINIYNWLIFKAHVSYVIQLGRIDLIWHVLSIALLMYD